MSISHFNNWMCLFFSVQKKSNKKKAIEPEDSIDFDDDDENSKDWWTKYFWSYEKLIDDAKGQTFRITGGSCNVPNGKEDKSKLGVKGSKLVARLSPKHRRKVERSKASTALCQACFLFVIVLDSVIDIGLTFLDVSHWVRISIRIQQLQRMAAVVSIISRQENWRFNGRWKSNCWLFQRSN